MTTAEAVKKLTSELKADAGFRESYKANIALAFYDEYFSKENFPETPKMKVIIHEIANNAADRFLNLWCA